MAAYCQVYGVIHFTSPAGWLPVHRDQLRAQRAVTSMGKLYLYLYRIQELPFGTMYDKPNVATLPTEFDQFIRFGNISACDAQTNRQMSGHRAAPQAEPCAGKAKKTREKEQRTVDSYWHAMNTGSFIMLKPAAFTAQSIVRSDFTWQSLQLGWYEASVTDSRRLTGNIILCRVGSFISSLDIPPDISLRTQCQRGLLPSLG